MNEFWSNILRYPRFFVSSLVGLILVILTPFRNLLKIQRFKFIFPFIILSSLLIIYLILLNMTGF